MAIQRHGYDDDGKKESLDAICRKDIKECPMCKKGLDAQKSINIENNRIGIFSVMCYNCGYIMEFNSQKLLQG
ncbi:MAG: hypothetical protein LBT50_09790 [Prevotellaceae bacterium]|jgi:transcription elongation factor Elf1|nr:hypothetical protein [Prevotellaceae bacterium]